MQCPAEVTTPGASCRVATPLDVFPGCSSGVNRDVCKHLHAARQAIAEGVRILQRNEDVVVERIGSNAVRIRSGGHVLDPLVRVGIDHAEHGGRRGRCRIGEEVAGARVVVTVARVVPGFILPTDLGDVLQDLSRAPVDDVGVRSESGWRRKARIAADKDVLSWSLRHPGGLAMIDAVEHLCDSARDRIHDSDCTVIGLGANLHDAD